MTKRSIAYLVILTGITLYMIPTTNEEPIISPCHESPCVVEPTPQPTPDPTATPSATVTPQKPVSVRGVASYYSREGCLGCSATLTMANGDPLDDGALTVAYNRAKLNSYVTITNLKTKLSVQAKVTDRGGFERHGKIVDLTIATRDALGCGSVCDVEISHE